MPSCKVAWGIWLFHIYPLLYLWASLQKIGSIFSLYYCGLVFVLVHVSTSPVLLDGGTLRLLCGLLAALSTALLAASLLMHLLHYCAWAGVDEFDFLGLLGPGGHTDVAWLFTDCIVAAASIASWVVVNSDPAPPPGSARSSLSWNDTYGTVIGAVGAISGGSTFMRDVASVASNLRLSVSSSSSMQGAGAAPPEILARTRRATLRGVAVQSAPLTRSSRMWQFCTWLFVCALLDCNLFAAAYMLAAVTAALSLALWPAPHRPLWTGLIDRACKAMLFLVSAHLSVAAICSSFLHRYGAAPHWICVLLGEPSCYWRNAQCLCVLPLAVELLRSRVHEGVRGGSLFQISGSEAPSASFELAGMSAAGPSVTPAGEEPDRQEADEQRIESLELEGAFSTAASSNQGEDQEAAGARAQADAQQDVVSNPPLRWRDNLLRFCITVISRIKDEDRPATCIKYLGSLLSLLSLCTWPLIWPGILSIPLLVCGLVALEKNLYKLHRWTLHSLAVYEGLLCIGLLVSSIWYDMRGKIDRWETEVGVRDFYIFAFISGQPRLRRSLLLACLTILLQLLSLSAFCMGEAAIPPGDLSLSQRRQEWRSTRSRTLFFIRMVIVAAVVMLALGTGPSGETSLVQLGYLLWFLGLLYRSDELPINLVGWDVLRGNVDLWRGLQTYSGSVAVALLSWRALRIPDLPLIGFLHDHDDTRYLSSLGMHLSLAVLAATQSSTLSKAKLMHHSSMFLRITNPVRWLLNCGILLHYSLLLLAALLPPHSIDAFILLVLACSIVLASQFSMQRKYFLPWLRLSATISISVLVFRTTVELTSVQAFLEWALPRTQYPVIWKVFALKTCDFWCISAKIRLRVMAVLVLLSRVLASSIQLSIMREDENMYIEPLPPRSALALRVAQRWSPLLLILTFYISVISHPLDFLSSFQLVTLEICLIIGKGWEYAGAFLSICTCTLLIAQYLCRYDFIYLADDQKEYWGLEWTFGSVIRELFLLVCAIIQRTIHYHAVAAQTVEDHSWLRRSSNGLLPANCNSDISVQDQAQDEFVALTRIAVQFCSTLGAYGAHIGIVILLLVSVIHSSVWSVAFAATVAAFLLSGDASHSLKPRQTKAWLKTMAVMVMFAPLSASLLELWLPPRTIARPSAASLGDSVVCFHFEQNLLRSHDGKLCHDATMADCIPQSQRCGQDWCDWLLMGRRGEPEFLAFFLLCVIHRADVLLLGARKQDDLDELVDAEVDDRSEVGAPDVGDSCSELAPRISVQESNEASAREAMLARTAVFNNDVAPNPVVDLEDGSTLEAQHLQSSKRQISRRNLGFPESKSETPSVAIMFQSRARMFTSGTSIISSLDTDMANMGESFEHGMSMDDHGWRCIYATTAALWIAMFAAYASQNTTDVIAMGYLFLLIDHMGSLGNATLARDPIQAFLRPTLKVTTFNFIVIVSSMAFQCPSMPCPYTIELPMTEESHIGGAGAGSFDSVMIGPRVRQSVSSFMSNRQCRDQEEGSEQMEAAGSLSGAIFRCIGLMKSSDPLTDNASRIWALVIFILCLLQTIFTSRWRLQLVMYLEAERRRLKGRAAWYIAKLLSQRHLQLSSWDTKRLVLLTKLSRLTEHLDMLRAIWDGQREGFTDAEDELREWENRIENVCLESGQDRKMVERLLEEFDHAAAGLTSSAAKSQSISQQVNTDKIDEYLLKYLHYTKLRALRKITVEEEEQKKEDFLRLCRALTWETKRRSSLKGLMGSRWSIHGPQPGLRELIAAHKPSAGSDESCPLGEADDPDAAAHAADEKPSTMTDLTRSVLEAGLEASPEGYLYSCIQGMLCFCIDDTIFYRERDKTLRQHREKDGLGLLFLKAILSQSVQMLVVTTFLQFSCYRSVTAAIPAVAVSMSLMAFPHVPWQFWVVLQWYNLIVIFAKLLIQLPLFCADGTIRMAPSGGLTASLKSCPPCSSSRIPWIAIFGLLKVQGVHRKDESEDYCMYANSYTELLWADLLVAMVVLLSIFVSRWSGRFENLSTILQLFREQDRAIAEGLGKGEDVKDWLSYLQEHAMVSPRASACTGHTMSSEPTEAQAFSRTMTAEARRWFRQIFDELGRLVIGSSWTRRPSLDLYPYRFFCMMVCLIILLLGWGSMMGTGRTFAESVSSSSFSGTQAIVLVIFMVGVTLDRALYTWYTHDPFEYEHGPDDTSEECSVRMSTRSSQEGSKPNRIKMIVHTIQKGLVIVELFLVHIGFIHHWSRDAVPMGVKVNLLCMDNAVTCLFYACFATYLALTSLQLRYDVHVMRGGLRVTHSDDLFTKNMFRIYSVLPFLHEMRVLTDWTVTTTSLNFFMWMKLEDAHHNLYRTRCDFLYRAETSDAERRPLCEKLLVGGLLLIVLLALLVGPVVFFSTLNWFWAVPNPVSSARLSVSLEVQPREGEDVRAMELYTAGQFHITKLGRIDTMSLLRYFARDEAKVMLQQTVFPESSDNFWMINHASRDQMAELLASRGVRAFVVVSLSFERMGVKAFGKDRVELESETMEDLANVLDTSEGLKKTVAFSVPNLFLPFKLLNARSDVMNVKLAGAPLDVHMKLHADKGGGPGLPYWTLARVESKSWPCKNNWQDTPPTPGSDSKNNRCRLSYTVASEDVSQMAGDQKGGGGGITVMGLYIGVIYSIGQSLRSVFKGTSKDIIYEEMPDTHLLFDLCNGIYIARIQGNLDAEYKLYHELIRIYRSPELLSHIATPKRRKQPESVLGARSSTVGIPSIRTGPDGASSPEGQALNRRASRQ